MKAILLSLAVAGLLTVGAHAADASTGTEKQLSVVSRSRQTEAGWPIVQGCCRQNTKGDKGAEAKLIEKVKKAGSGVWGAIPMPPNRRLAMQT